MVSLQPFPRIRSLVTVPLLATQLSRRPSDDAPRLANCDGQLLQPIDIPQLENARSAPKRWTCTVMRMTRPVPLALAVEQTT